MAVRCSVPALLSAFLVLPEPAHAQMPCFVDDQEYVGKLLILPGYTHNAAACQLQCKITYLCAYFTYKAHPDFPRHGSGACLKYGSNVTLQPVGGNSTGVASGPVSCPTTTVMGTTLTLPSGNASVAPIVPTLVPIVPTGMPTVMPTAMPTAMPTVMPTIVPTMLPNGTNMTNSTNGTVIGGDENEGGGFPWWAILILALVVLGVLAVVLYGGCGDDKKKKKKKSKKGLKEARGASTEMSPEVEAPLVTGQAPSPVQEPVASPPLPPPASQMAGGSVQVAGSPAAEPVTTMSGNFPIGSTGQQVVYSQSGQPMYMPAQQVTTVQMPMMPMQQQARQPVFR